MGQWDIGRCLAMLAWTLPILGIFAACGGSQPTQAFTRAPDTTFLTPPASIDPSGGTDVTAALNHFFDSVPDSSSVSLPDGARYRAEGVVRLIGKTNLTIEGNGALIFAETDGSGVVPPEGLKLKHLWPRARSHIEISGGNNIVIRDLVIRGANPNAGSEQGAYVSALEGQHGFDIRGVDGLILDHVTVTDTYGDLVYIGGVPETGHWACNIQIINSHFERSGRQGIAVTGAENVQFLNSYVGEIGRTIIDLEPATLAQGARNILFEGNTFGPSRHLLMSSGGGGPNVNDIFLLENSLVGMGLKIRVAAADGARRSNYRILNNISDTTLGLPVAAVRLSRVDGVEIRGNYQVMNANRDMTAVKAVESCNVTVQDNQFPNSLHIAEIQPYVCPIP